MRFFGFAAVAFGLVLSLGLGRSEAGLLPVSVSVSPDAGNYRYTYSVDLTSDSTIKSGDYFTIYDFKGLVGGTNAQPTGFSYSSQAVGPTPPGTLPADSPGVNNVTFTYNGPSTMTGQTSIGSFSVDSIYGGTTNGTFTALTQRQFDGQNDSNITSTQVPVPNGVPEPSSIVLFVVGLALFGGLGYLRRHQVSLRSV